MNETGFIEWAVRWGPFVTLLSTVLLLAITGWLAFLTKSMADSSKTAADHAKTAAQASLAAVQASESSVDVSFSLSLSYSSSVGALREALEQAVSEGMSGDMPVSGELLGRYTKWSGASLRCEGAAIYVHELRLVRVGWHEEATGNFTTIRSEHQPDETSVLLSKVDLPKLCHKGEIIDFGVQQHGWGGELAEVQGVVAYSFGQDGKTRERLVHWRSKQYSTSPIQDSVTPVSKSPAPPA